MRDYRISHTTVFKAERYEHEIYRQGTYDDILWQEEKKILEYEVSLLGEHVPTIAYLDFACGGGRILEFLEHRVDTALGVDLARSMLDLAAKKVKKAKLISADLTQSDILRGSQYDLITAFRFFLNAQPELRERALAVLVPKLRNSRSILIFNVHGNLLSFRLLSKLWYRVRGRRLNTLTLWSIKNLLARHNIEVQRWYGIGVLPKTLYRFLPNRFLTRLDQILTHLPLLRYISYDLVFVCHKK